MLIARTSDLQRKHENVCGPRTHTQMRAVCAEAAKAEARVINSLSTATTTLTTEEEQALVALETSLQQFNEKLQKALTESLQTAATDGDALAAIRTQLEAQREKLDKLTA